MARLVHTSIAVLGFLIAISVNFAPSFQAADLITLPGIGTVAIGFAFQFIELPRGHSVVVAGTVPIR